ncbi:hypothetical protein OAP01_00935 [Akkermansiaceae bacterium]|nr:hypothetical protein [Akkermansiaceae bacterium]
MDVVLFLMALPVSRSSGVKIACFMIMPIGRGGTWKERRDADRKLRDGIRCKGKPVIAQLAYVGVRVGGTPWLPTPWRWGFGWHEFPRGYRPVSLDEWLMIKKITPLLILEK